MNPIQAKHRTYDDSNGTVRGITSDGREVLLVACSGGFKNLTDGGYRIADEDLDWDQREGPIDPELLREARIF